MDLIVKPGGVLHGEITIPGDKSISHRAVILGSLSVGTTILHGFLEAKDCLATVQAMQSLGVPIEHKGKGTLIIHGVGLKGLQAPSEAIDCGNAGTLMRLLAGVLAAQPFKSVLKGDESLQRRPMERIIDPLTKMGAKITGQIQFPHLVAPLVIQGEKLQGIHYNLPLASAQVKSCLLLAGLFAKNETILTEKAHSRDHTERMLLACHAPLRIKGDVITLFPGEVLKAQEITIPGDISSAAFFIAGASMKEGARILLRGVGMNERRMGIIPILSAMGAKISISNISERNHEHFGDIQVIGTQLKGIIVPQTWIASAIDEFPILFVAAACASGTTEIRGIGELRVKESDRIAVMVKGLRQLGIALEEFSDGVLIQGGILQGGIVQSEGDHRVAMAFAMAALFAKKEIIIQNCDNIATSFPHFCDVAKRLGLVIEAEHDTKKSANHYG